MAAMVTAILLLFANTLITKQQEFLLSQNEQSGTSLAQALATSSSAWVLSNDVAGLKEIVNSIDQYPDLRYAMILTPDGRVLSHSADEFIGLYLKDDVSRQVLSGSMSTHVVVRTPELVDIAAPIYAGSEAIGWVRVGMGQEDVLKNISSIKRHGWLLGALAVLLSIVLTMGLTRNLTRGLERLVELAGEIGRGQARTRFSQRREDEVGKLGAAFDRMATDLENSSMKLKESLLEVTDLYNQAPCGYHSLSPEGVVLRINDTELRWLGYAREEVVGKLNFRDVLSPESQKTFDRQFPKFLKTGIVENIEHELLCRDGRSMSVLVSSTLIKDQDGKILMTRTTVYDISQRKAAEQQIEQLAFYDALTRLPNRRLLMERLHHAQTLSMSSNASGALMYVDIDHFKRLNDALGLAAGDLLLQEVAFRLTSCVPSDDTVARLGADEFVVVLNKLDKHADEAAADARLMAEKIRSALQPAYHIEGQHYEITLSIGITVFSGSEPSAADLVKQADLAMYQAKAAGRNCARFFDPAMEEAVASRARLENDMSLAIKQNELLLHYQPQVDRDGRTTGVEALLRWRHPVQGMISPARFIPLAEESGLILPMGEWVLHTACAQLKSWSADPATQHLTIAVNVSAHQFLHADFVTQVLHALTTSGADPKKLKLELTESVLVSGVEEIVSRMATLKNLGISFSLDDFGTGYSSLSYLKKLPLDQLKIDQSFVRDVLTDPNDAAIARTIVALGRSMGLDVIAEGVETQQQRDFLLGIDCVACQGYLFGRPMPADELERHLERNGAPS